MDSTVIFFIIFMFHPFPYRWGLNLDLNGFGSITSHLSDPENCEFDTNLCRFALFLHVTPLPSPTLGVLAMSYTQQKFYLKVSHMCIKFGLNCFMPGLHYSSPVAQRVDPVQCC